ncbi:MAG TPA: hypothetical protein VF748_15015 [Candidatus Acidoferrum sp.]
MGEEVLISPAVSIQVTCDPKGNRMFDVRFAPLPLDTPAATLDETMTRFLRAVDRQQHYYEMLNLTDDIRDAMTLLDKYEEAGGEVEEQSKARWEREGRRGTWGPDHLSGQERQARDTLRTNIKVKRQEVAALGLKLERLQSRSNGHGSVVGTNSNAGRPGG